MASKSSSHPALSAADGLASGSADALLLIGRVLLGWLFVAAGWGKIMNMAGFAGYLTSLGTPAAGLLSNIVPFIEFGMGVCLVLGLATRYAAIVTFLFCLIAAALAHRYWEYPAAQQAAQYTNFLKAIAFMGAALIVLVTGAGRYSVDAALAKK
ncbi:MAG: DoxX family protein [Pseudorhodoplanes sp.]|nr:MAG: DoxX family protein [Pseudorhodoplanes sp.]MBZ0140741.1 DoxX family protein [Pseudorhodoplanes sp.]